VQALHQVRGELLRIASEKTQRAEAGDEHHDAFEGFEERDGS